MNKSLYVTSRSGDQQLSSWGPVARLDKIDYGWRFLYLEGARMEQFQPFYEFPVLDIVYESEDLFPLFANRLLSKSRKEYESWLSWGGFDSEDPPSPITLLGVTEGRRVTDPIEVFPCPQPDGDGCYLHQFFVHGVRWMPEAAQQAINCLSPGDELGLLPDLFNKFDPNAIALRPMKESIGRHLIGYIPRYLASDICKIYEKCDPEFITTTVKQVNHKAPWQQRLLCQISACWPDGFQPCATPEFRSIVQEYELAKLE